MMRGNISSGFTLNISIVIIVSIFDSSILFAQPTIRNPSFENFQPIVSLTSINTMNNYNRGGETIQNAQNNIIAVGANASDIIKQSQSNALRQMGVKVPGQTANQSKELNEIRSESHRALDVRQKNIEHFSNYFKLLEQLNPDSFSITKAVYLSEAAFYDKPFTYDDFEKTIKQVSGFVKKILTAEGLDEKNNVAANYAIQKLYQQDNIVHDDESHKDIVLKKLQYDFDDYNGEKDWSKMFVTKILQTGSGQCHSLPLLYLCLAEQLHAKAYLSLAPNHSFIEYFDEKNRRYNYETTNGNLVTQTWLMQSTYVNATAIKNKTYLDTLSSRKLYAQCLADFLQGYLVKVGYDNISDRITNKILSVDSTNITALMLQANLYNYVFQIKLKKAGMPPPEDYTKYPELSQAYEARKIAIAKVQETGFQEMPEEAYRQWLQSLNEEKRKQESKLEQEKIAREIKKIKAKKSTFSNMKN
ncbi:MAG: hypothetical protein ABUT20_41440 [Bacteroidota bacterium]